ncbi:MAG: DUF4194 domain-containing protein [Eggerthellaceae bacterium]|nr:DUF4194 domain-containing protein [Eggerthellaceae bacterium]
MNPEKDTSIADESNDNDATELWPGDAGTLTFESRRALLQLIKGPMITAEANKELWQALLMDQASIESRLADLFLVLVLDEDEGIAFVQNAPAVDRKIPKAVRNQPLTLSDTILVLSLRRELMINREGRVFVDKEETFSSLSQYRPLEKLDEAGFRKRLERSWSKLEDEGMLLKAEGDERYEISPVLRLIFSTEEVKAVTDAIDSLVQDPDAVSPLADPAVDEELETEAEDESEEAEDADIPLEEEFVFEAALQDKAVSKTEPQQEKPKRRSKKKSEPPEASLTPSLFDLYPTNPDNEEDYL